MKIPFFSFFSGKSGRAVGNPRAFDAAQRTKSQRKISAGRLRDAAADLPSWTRTEILEKTRFCMNNFGVAKELVGSTAIYAVGDGIYPQPRSRDAAFNDAAAATWKRFARRAELSGLSFRKLQELVSRALDTDGEIFAVKTELDGRPALQLLETHRLSMHSDAENGVTDGIRFDALGRPQSYFFTGAGEGAAPIEIPAADVIRVANVERISFTRALPTMQHAVIHLLDASQILKMEKENVKVAEQTAMTLSSDTAEAEELEPTFFSEKPSEEETKFIPRPDGGNILELPAGKRLSIVESNRPSPTFNGFMKELLRDSALGIMPYEVAVDASEIGGASIRLQTAKTDRRISARQQDLIEQFLTPVWLFVIGWSISHGELPAAEDWFEVEWSTPRRITVDAGREAAQMREDVKAGLLPIEDFYSAMGYGTFEDELERRAQLMRRAKELAGKYGVAVEQLVPALFSGAAPAAPSQKQP